MMLMHALAEWKFGAAKDMKCNFPYFGTGIERVLYLTADFIQVQMIWLEK